MRLRYVAVYSDEVQYGDISWFCFIYIYASQLNFLNTEYLISLSVEVIHRRARSYKTGCDHRRDRKETVLNIEIRVCPVYHNSGFLTALCNALTQLNHCKQCVVGLSRA